MAFETSYENLLAELFDLDIDTTKTDVPIGAILAQRICVEKPLNSHHWLRGVPVNLIPDRDRLLLYQMEQQARTQAEIFTRQIADELLNIFDDLFAEILVDDTSGWLFRLKQPAQITTSSINEVSGKNIENFLPAGDQASQWIAVFNEIQMILHAADSADYGFNALWFEGVGSLPGIRSIRRTGSIGNENLFRAVSECSQAKLYDESSDVRGWTDGLERLIVSDMNILQAVNEQSEESLQQSLQTANVQFSQMLSLLDEGCLSQINVYPLNGSRFSIGKAGLLDLLKRRKELSELFEKTKS
ncbi:MAG: hypothetical protein HKP55_12495 [Gammaproteobacteria bacterium]|nr:hypothetical protein [Gammaproteobacteria bacterium]